MPKDEQEQQFENQLDILREQEEAAEGRGDRAAVREFKRQKQAVKDAREQYRKKGRKGGGSKVVAVVVAAVVVAGGIAVNTNSPAPAPHPQPPTTIVTAPSNVTGQRYDLSEAIRIARSGGTYTIKAGTYRGDFEVKASGTPDNPIVFMAAPGERVTIDGGKALTVRGDYVHFVNLEITNSTDIRAYGDYAKAVDVPGKDTAVRVLSTGVKFINCVVHDGTGSAFGAWELAHGLEIYGCLIYYNGISKFGHGIYGSGESANPKIFSDNVIWGNSSNGITLHYNEGAIGGYRIEGNVLFNNGVIYDNGRELDLGGGKHISDVVVSNNFIYAAANRRAALVDTKAPRGFMARDNFIVGRIEQRGAALDLGIRQAGRMAQDVFVRPNKYESGRALIFIYNRVGASIMAVDLSGILKSGQKFQIRNSQNFYGSPVASGTLDGRSVMVPLNNNVISDPVPSNFPRATLAPMRSNQFFCGIVLPY